MEALVDAIRVALVADASPEARAAGANACRTILAALEAQPGQAMTTAPPSPSQIASMVGALRGVPPEQLLDLAIDKLRAALPPETKVAPVRPLKFHIVSLPRRS